MFGCKILRVGRISLISAMIGCFLALTSAAQSADFDGDCCAGLEERLVELEKTTVRKGNQKLSLKIYGIISRAVLYWNDGQEDDVYVVQNDYKSTRMGFKGAAKINTDWSAGYKIELSFEEGDSSGVHQRRDNNSAIHTRKSYVFVKNKRLGKVSVGLTSVATDDVTHKAFQVRQDYIRPNWRFNRGFFLRRSDVQGPGGLINQGTTPGNFNEYDELGELCGSFHDDDECFDAGSRRNVVRYQSPQLRGFTFIAAWGEDDLWDVALDYRNKIGDFKFGARGGYFKTLDENNKGNVTPGGFRIEEESIAGSVSLYHLPTGLFINGSYRTVEISDHGGIDPITGQIANLPDSNAYYAQLGLKRHLNDFGATLFWGEYADAKDGFIGAVATNGASAESLDGRNFAVAVAGPGSLAVLGLNGATKISSSELSRWGLGVAQEIDAADMALYTIFQYTEPEVTLIDQFGTRSAVPLEDIWTVAAGAHIKF